MPLPMILSCNLAPFHVHLEVPPSGHCPYFVYTSKLCLNYVPSYTCMPKLCGVGGPFALWFFNTTDDPSVAMSPTPVLRTDHSRTPEEGGLPKLRSLG